MDTYDMMKAEERYNSQFSSGRTKQEEHDYMKSHPFSDNDIITIEVFDENGVLDYTYTSNYDYDDIERADDEIKAGGHAVVHTRYDGDVEFNEFFSKKDEDF